MSCLEECSHLHMYQEQSPSQC